MKTLLRRAAVTLVVLVPLGIGAFFAHRYLSQGEPLPVGLAAAERALTGAPDAWALVAVDLAGLRERLPAQESGPDLEAELWRGLGPGSEVLGRAATRALFAVAGPPEAPRVSAVLFGDFDVAALEAALETSTEHGVERAQVDGAAVLRPRRLDLDSCDWATPFDVALSAERIAIAPRGDAAALLRALDAPAARALPAWQQGFEPFASGQLAALALRPPDAGARLEGLTGVWGASARLARVEGAQAVHARIGLAGLTRALQGELELRAASPEAADALLARWEAARAELPRHWGQHAAGLHGWLVALEPERDGARVLARAAPPAGNAVLARIADDWIALASLDFAPGLTAPSEAPTAALAAWPTRFRRQLRMAAIGRYDVDAPLIGAVDQTTGPFGVRIERVALARTGSGALELSVRGIGPDLDNLAGAGRAELRIDSAQDEDGRDLLAGDACGRAAQSHALRLEREPVAERITGVQRVWLAPGVGVDDVRRLAGRIDLHLPVATTTLRLEQVEVGAVIEHAGARLELTSASPAGFAYALSGARERVLAVRGLNAESRPLGAAESWERALLGSAGSVGLRRYGDGFRSLEVVFADAIEHASHAFVLESIRPGSQGESRHVQSAAFIEYTSEQFQKEFGGRAAPVWPRARPALAIAHSGPFTLALEALGRPKDDPAAPLRAELAVLAPNLPNLTYNATGLKLRSARLRTQGGRAPLRETDGWLASGYKFGRDDLWSRIHLDTGQDAAPDHVRALEGELVLRLPGGVDAVELAAEPGRQAQVRETRVQVVALARDAIRLRVDDPDARLFSVQAFGDEDQELEVERSSRVDTGDGRSELDWTVHGQAKRLLVQVGRDYATTRFPFALELPQALPAAAAD